MHDYPAEYDPAFHDDLKVLLETKNENLIRNLLASMHPADLADLLEHLDDEDRFYVFSLLPDKESSQTLAEMEDGARESVLQDLESSEIADLIEEMDSDDAADLLRDLPDHVVQEVLTGLSPHDSLKVRRLLAYDEETAGGIMATELVKISETATVQDAIDQIRIAGEEFGDIPQIFVVDHHGRLTGFLSLRDILLSDPSAAISVIVNREVRSVLAGMDQEEVAELVRKYDLAVVPVIDEQGCPIGIITHDDILDVYEEEASEDIARLSGNLQEESPSDSIVDVTRNRLPWLLLGLAGGTVAAFVISHFTKSIQEALQISFFIPVIAAMGGNVGMQSSAVIVRGLATGEIDQANTRLRLIKEITVGCINALLLALVLWAVVYFWLDDFKFGLVVGVSLAVAMIIAAFIGSSVPIALRRIGIDPALATGPFVTTTNDILALSIYLILTTVMMKYM